MKKEKEKEEEEEEKKTYTYSLPSLRERVAFRRRGGTIRDYSRLQEITRDY